MNNTLYKTRGKNDERYTPEYGVKPILKYIPEGAVVWCPFDTRESEFVKLISKQNKVIASHKNHGQDFYEYQPNEHWDCIVSNPPFTKKRDIFKRAIELTRDNGKSFALLMSTLWINDGAPVDLFIDECTRLELLLFNKRIHYLDEDYQEMGKNTTFASSYYCYNFLPSGLVLQRL